MPVLFSLSLLLQSAFFDHRAAGRIRLKEYRAAIHGRMVDVRKKKTEKKAGGVVDRYCLGCRYLCSLKWGEDLSEPDRYYCCDYICRTGKRRPCPAGKGCRVKEREG